jgi:hypothetical protein
MKLSPRTFITFAFAIALTASTVATIQAAPQKKKKKGNAPPTVKLETVTQPAKAPAAAPPQSPVTKPAATAEPLPAEKDPQREAWRINVEPYAIFGSGRPGKGAADFDKPDGVGFTPNGLLLATDAKNRRVQIWDVKTKMHLGEFGHGVFGGAIVDIAVAPNGMALITDQTLNLAYAFMPFQADATGDKGAKGKKGSAIEYEFKGTRFGERGFDKLGGIAIDSRGRTYAVDAHLNEVRRYTADGAIDPQWKFEKARPGGDTYLHGCEGIAIDEAASQIFIASEKDAVIQVFDWETGAYKGKLIGAKPGATGKPEGTRIFSGSVEGLAMANNHLLAVDESVGHIQVFDLSQTNVFNTDLAGYTPGRVGGYKGFFCHSPQVDFEDKDNKTLQQQVKDGAIIPGQANPPGYFCSPDSIASYKDKTDGETYVAIADQCNYRLAVYRWSDINRAMNVRVLASASTPVSGNREPALKSAKGTHKKGKKKP